MKFVSLAFFLVGLNISVSEDGYYCLATYLKGINKLDASYPVKPTGADTPTQAKCDQTIEKTKENAYERIKSEIDAKQFINLHTDCFVSFLKSNHWFDETSRDDLMEKLAYESETDEVDQTTSSIFEHQAAYNVSETLFVNAAIQCASQKDFRKIFASVMSSSPRIENSLDSSDAATKAATYNYCGQKLIDEQGLMKSTYGVRFDYNTSLNANYDCATDYVKIKEKFYEVIEDKMNKFNTGLLTLTPEQITCGMQRYHEANFYGIMLVPKVLEMMNVSKEHRILVRTHFYNQMADVSRSMSVCFENETKNIFLPSGINYIKFVRKVHLQ